ncbi:uncharacterized protein LOC107425925 [Ziziphus jujuba]|uniref:Uncharacterized protein LOC107425925 n=1 Tax=Ziziphus jujuba TaxID=326968 RepID=A0ABM3ZSI4_ZIZJJ|nr:uncharacterized protein LOC107425925 [Ziziphus jujuba]
MEPPPSTPHNTEEYSASSTIIAFDPPIPLLRGPVPADRSDNPLAGPYVLSFRNSKAWANAYRACESKIIEQCEAGARIGCTISASSKCKPPWWRALCGFRVSDLKEREQCEEREMEGCLVTAKEKCIGFARDKCLKSLRDGRIAASRKGLNAKQLEKLVCWATMVDRSIWVDLIGIDQLGSLSSTNYRACELIGSNADIDCILGCGNSGNEASKL